MILSWTGASKFYPESYGLNPIPTEKQMSHAQQIQENIDKDTAQQQSSFVDSIYFICGTLLLLGSIIFLLLFTIEKYTPVSGVSIISSLSGGNMEPEETKSIIAFAISGAFGFTGYLLASGILSSILRTVTDMIFIKFW